MSAAVLSRWPYELHRLLFSTGELAAIDLRQRFAEVQLWFAGEHIYNQLPSAVYPPASYAIMWPFMGHPSWELAKWVWALSSVVLLGILIRLMLSAGKISRPRYVWFWSLFFFAHYATGITIGNGQLTIHIMAALAGCAVLLSDRQVNWRTSLAIGALAALAIIKPTVSLPFMWLILFVPRSLWPAIFTVAVYGGLAVLAGLFQARNLVQLHRDWLALGLQGAAWSSRAGSTALSPDVSSLLNDDIPLFGDDIGYGDLHSLLGIFDLGHLAMPLSLGLLGIFGVWVYCHRRCNVWTLMGAAAVISRLWTYHRVYDDMLAIFALFAIVIALQKLPEALGPRATKLGYGLVAATIFCSLVPASLRLLPTPLDLPFKFGQMALWLTMLGYLLYVAWVERCAQESHKHQVAL